MFIRYLRVGLVVTWLIIGFGIQAAFESAELKSRALTPYAYVGQNLIAARGGVEQIVVPEEKDNKPHFDVIQLTEQQKLSMAFQLFAKNEQNKDPISENACILIKDLDLYSQLFPCIDNTKTMCGKAVLACELVKPDHKKACAHQELVRLLVDDAVTYTKVDTLLKNAAEAENALFSFQVDETPIAKKLIDQLYFGKWFSGANKSAYALETRTRFDNIGSFVRVAQTPAIMTIAHYMQLEFFAFMGMPIQPSWRKAAMMTLAKVNPASYVKDFKDIHGGKQGAFFAKLFAGSFDNVSESNEWNNVPGLTAEVAYVFFALDAFGTVMNVYQEGLAIKDVVAHVCQVRDTTNYLQARLIGVAAFVDSLKKIKGLAKKSPVFAQGLTKLGAIDTLLGRAESTSQELQTLIKLLKTNTFKGHPSYFSLTGRILAAYKMMEELKDAFIPAMEALGELDACYSMAQLYKKFVGQRVVYSFVTFKESATPYLKLEDFWNPVVDPLVVVPNDIELGGANGARSVILTGSNTGGKSTVLKAMLFDMLLAQTFGIAPAKSMVITPWTYIGSSLHILDNTADGISLFKAEVLRAQALLKAFEALLQYQFGFIVIDELFTGTAAEVGQAQAFDFVQRLSRFSNTVFILATHFSNLTDLEKVTGGVCKNYKVDVKVASDGTIIRPFKLEEGICTTNIAQNILHEAIGDINAQSMAV